MKYERDGLRDSPRIIHLHKQFYGVRVLKRKKIKSGVLQQPSWFRCDGGWMWYENSEHGSAHLTTNIALKQCSIESSHHEAPENCVSWSRKLFHLESTIRSHHWGQQIDGLSYWRLKIEQCSSSLSRQINSWLDIFFNDGISASVSD